MAAQKSKKVKKAWISKEDENDCREKSFVKQKKKRKKKVDCLTVHYHTNWEIIYVALQTSFK